jgi:hypothetical protein
MISKLALRVLSLAALSSISIGLKKEHRYAPPALVDLANLSLWPAGHPARIEAIEQAHPEDTSSGDEGLVRRTAACKTEFWDTAQPVTPARNIQRELGGLGFLVPNCFWCQYG